MSRPFSDVPEGEIRWTLDGTAPRETDARPCPRCGRDTCAGCAPHGVAVSVGSTPEDRLTEAGAAERFVRLHGDDVRFDHRRARWLIWQGHRWAPDADAAVTRLALTFARAWQREAAEIPDRDRRERVFRLAVRLERRDALHSMLALARDLRPIADAGDRWDRDLMVFGVPNGVVDLRSGRLRCGERADRITMQAGVAYDPHATCPRWQRFVEEVFVDPALVTFGHRATGYSLTGDTTEQCLLMPYGTGANGKTTFLRTVKAVLGDYAWNMPFSTLELHQRSAIPNDLAALVGRRFVVASETNDGTRLNEARIKALTGNDPIAARFLHGEFFEFEPITKFWLSVNHKPIVQDDSLGFWRRMRVLPFGQTFPVNPTLADALLAELPGILAWAVRGCLDWQRHGLGPPDVVTEATREYERDSDGLAAFLDEACKRDEHSQVRASELYQHYKWWADKHGLTERERLSATMFGRKIGERFQKDTDPRNCVVYLGIARRPEEPQ